jgi:hypothetical protein
MRPDNARPRGLARCSAGKVKQTGGVNALERADGGCPQVGLGRLPAVVLAAQSQTPAGPTKREGLQVPQAPEGSAADAPEYFQRRALVSGGTPRTAEFPDRA